MKDKYKTKDQLINELTELRKSIRAFKTFPKDQKQTHEKLRESVEFIGSIIHAISGSIFVKNEQHRPYTKIVDGINSALKIMGEFAHADRCYIFLPSEDGKRLINTYKWCAKGIKSQKQKIQDIPIEIFPWALEKLKRFEVIHIPHVPDHPPEAESKRNELLAQGIKSIILVPIILKGNCKGALCLDTVREEKEWSDEVLSILKIAGCMISNVLDRKRIEEVFIEDVEKYRNMVENSNDGICIVQDQLIKFCNKQSINLIGYSVDEVVDTSFTNYVHPNQLQELLGIYTRFMSKEEENLRFETILIHKNGQEIIVELNISAINYNGRRAALIFIRDMTDRKQAEEEIKKFKTISDKANYGIAISDLKGNLIYLNKSFTKMHGYSPQELTGKHISVFHTKEQMEDVNQLTRLLKTKGSFSAKEVWHKRKDHSIFPTLMNATIINDDKEIPLFLAATAIDITEYKKAEEALQKSEEKYRDMVENISDVIYSTDEKGIMTFVSPVVESYLGYSPSEIVGRSFMDFILSEDLPKCIQNFQLILSNLNVSGEYRILTKTGKIRWIRTSTKPIFRKGCIIGTHGVFSDITKQKKTEEALHEREEKYRLMSENIPVTVYSALSDEYPASLFMTGRIKQLTGYSAKQFLDDSELFLRLIHPDDRDYIWQKIKDRCKKKGILDLEYRIINKNNKIKWVKDRATHVCDRTGRIIRIDGFLEDITERKRVGKALLDSERKFKALSENSPNMIFINKGGRIVYVNKKCEEAMGYKKEEFYSPGFDFLCLVAPEYHKVLKTNFKKHMNGEEVPAIEYAIVTKKGERIEAILTTKLIEYEKEKAILGIITDITERKRVEKELFLAKSYLEYLIESIPSVIYTCETHGDYAATYISENLFRILGYTPEEFLSDPKFWISHIHPDDVSNVLENVEEVFAKDMIIQEYRFLHKNRKYRWLSDDCRVIRDKQGKPLEIVGSIMDVTDKKSLEEEFFHSQKMEAVGRLAGGIAHDFNNILQTITGYCDLILLDSENKEQNLKDIKIIKEASHKAALLIKKLLAFSRKQSIKPIILNVNAIISDLNKMLKRLLGEDIDLQIILSPELKSIKADQTHIEQVIMNLVVNARDAMLGGGKLTIRTQDVTFKEKDCHHISKAGPGEFVCLSIEDTGIGIKREMMDHIFEPFFTTKKKGEGTGLGLPTVYGIVKDHKGWINIDSTPGKGTVFKIYFPSCSQKPEVSFCRSVSVMEFKGNGERILIVEDEIEVREFIKQALQNAGYVVFDASCAQEALDIINKEKGRFDLLLSDVVLPDQSGLFVMDKIKIMNPCTRIIMCSGYMDQRSQREIIHTKGIDFIQKPYSIADLLQSVKVSLLASHVK